MTIKTPEQRKDEALQACFYVDEDQQYLRIISADDTVEDEDDEDYEHTNGIYVADENSGEEYKISYHDIPNEAYFMKLVKID